MSFFVLKTLKNVLGLEALLIITTKLALKKHSKCFLKFQKCFPKFYQTLFFLQKTLKSVGLKILLRSIVKLAFNHSSYLAHVVEITQRFTKTMHIEKRVPGSSLRASLALLLVTTLSDKTFSLATLLLETFL